MPAVPALIRLYLRSMACGLALGLAFTALLLAADVGGLRHLLLHSRAGLLGAGLLALFHSLLFSGVQFGIQVMAMAEAGGSGSGRRTRLFSGRPRIAAQPQDKRMAGKLDATPFSRR